MYKKKRQSPLLRALENRGASNQINPFASRVLTLSFWVDRGEKKKTAVSSPAMGDVSDQHPARLLTVPKEGERILAPTRRPDGTLRKPIRIRAGYVPQDEVAIYKSKGVLLRKCAQPEYPPGYDPVLDAKPKTKSAKRNERKKEKKNQVALASLDDKGKDVHLEPSEKLRNETIHHPELMLQKPEAVELVTDNIKSLSLSATTDEIGPSTDLEERSGPGASASDIDKRIRALKKKIRLSEAQLNGERPNMKSEQLQKMAKVEGWREELKLLEDKKARMVL